MNCLHWTCNTGRPAAVWIGGNLRRRAGGRERGRLHRRHVDLLPEAGKRDGARRRGADRGVQLQQREAAHGRDGPLLHPRGRAQETATAAAAAGCRRQAWPVLQLPGLMWAICFWISHVLNLLCLILQSETLKFWWHLFWIWLFTFFPPNFAGCLPSWLSSNM